MYLKKKHTKRRANADHAAVVTDLVSKLQWTKGKKGCLRGACSAINNERKYKQNIRRPKCGHAGWPERKKK